MILNFLNRIGKGIRDIFFNRSSISLRRLLVISFMLQVLVLSSVIGYLSFEQSQKSANQLVQKLQQEIGQRIALNLDNYFKLPTQVVAITSSVLEKELIDPFDLKTTGNYFWKYSQVIKNIGWLGYYLSDRTGAGAGRWFPDYDGIVITHHPSGGLVDYSYATDESGSLTNVLEIDKNYDPLKESWYIDTMKRGKPSWTNVNIPQIDDYIGISFNQPLKFPHLSITGVVSLDLLLGDISSFVKDIKISPSMKIAIFERDGNMIASSSNFPVVKKEQNNLKRIHYSEYEDPHFQAIARVLDRQLVNLKSINESQSLEFELNGEKQFLYIKPWQDDYGLDLLVMISFPESDFLAEIKENNRRTVILSIIAMVFAILMGIVIAQLISSPLQKLSEQAGSIAQGDLKTRITVKQPIRELVLLSKSFNEMVRQLQYSFETLEENVTSRTQELNQAKELLEVSNEKLTNSVHEKEILIKEVHHRVKNNLLIIASLINWQEEDIDNPEILSIFADSQKRINSMALIHEKLYLSSDLAHIDFGDYLQTLSTQIFDSFCSDRNLILFHYDIFPIPLNVETATPCGLIVNELLLNTLEHAFVGVNQGNIFLTLKQDTNGKISLIVKDDGIGLPEGFNFRETKSLGWQLICLLTEQLEGDIQVTSPPGTTVELTFSELSYKPRLKTNNNSELS